MKTPTQPNPTQPKILKLLMLSLGILISLAVHAQQDIDYLDSDCYLSAGSCKMFWSSLQAGPESSLITNDDGSTSICGEAQVCLRTSTDCINFLWQNGLSGMNLTISLRTGAGFSQSVGVSQTLSWSSEGGPFNPNACFDIPSTGEYALHVRVDFINKGGNTVYCDQGILPLMYVGSDSYPNQFTISQLDPIQDPSLTVGGINFNESTPGSFFPGPVITLCNEEELFGTISNIAPNSEITITGLRFSPTLQFTSCPYTSSSNTFSIPFHDLECSGFNDLVNGGFTYVAVTVTSPLPSCAGGEGTVSETYRFKIYKIATAIEYSHVSTDIINGGQPNPCYIDDGDGDVSITANSNNLGSIPELGAETAGFIPGSNGLVAGASLLRYRYQIRQFAVDQTGVDRTILIDLFWTPVGSGGLPAGGVLFRNLSGWLGNDFNWFENHTYVGGGGANDVDNTANYEYELTIFAETDSPNCPELEYSSVFRICQGAIYLQEPGSGNESSLFAPSGTSETLFPNPASTNITLPSSIQDESIINVVNSAGSVILSVENHEPNGQLDISSLSPGSYWVRTISSNGELETHSFIKQ